MTVTAVEPTQTTAIGTLEDLLLLRLLPSGEVYLLPGKLAEDVAPLLADGVRRTDVEAQLGQLIERGWVEKKAGPRAKACRLTDRGRRQALDFLGVDHLPPRANWQTIQAKFLVPKALGLTPGTDSTSKILATGDALAAFLLKRRLGLPVGAGTTLSAVLEAVVCRELGYRELTSVAALQARVLSNTLGSSGGLTKSQITKQAPRVLLGAPRGGVEGLRAAVLSGAFAELDRSSEPAADPEAIQVESFDLTAFANTVRAAARDCRTGRLGDRKVFINHVWGLLRHEPVFRDLDLARFKQRLIEAHRQHLLTLTRADMAAHLDQSDVLESEARYFNSEFHFILDERNAP